MGGKLYTFWRSSASYRVRIALNLKGLDYEPALIHFRKEGGQHRKPEFLAKNPNHRVPLLEWPNGRCLAESNAILFYIADGSEFLPDDPWKRAQVLQWLFFEQYSHEPYIAVVRFWNFAGLTEENKDAIPEKMDRGYHALGVMERHLESREYFVGEQYSIADIALYAYTHVAHEGGFDLDRFPAVREWLDRVKDQPGHIFITDEVGQLKTGP